MCMCLAWLTMTFAYCTLRTYHTRGTTTIANNLRLVRDSLRFFKRCISFRSVWRSFSYLQFLTIVPHMTVSLAKHAAWANFGFILLVFTIWHNSIWFRRGRNGIFQQYWFQYVQAACGVFYLIIHTLCQFVLLLVDHKVYPTTTRVCSTQKPLLTRYCSVRARKRNTAWDGSILEIAS